MSFFAKDTTQTLSRYYKHRRCKSSLRLTSRWCAPPDALSQYSLIALSQQARIHLLNRPSVPVRPQTDLHSSAVQLINTQMIHTLLPVTGSYINTKRKTQTDMNEMPQEAVCLLQVAAFIKEFRHDLSYIGSKMGVKVNSSSFFTIFHLFWILELMIKQLKYICL